MSRKPNIDPKLVTHAKQMLATAQSVEQVRQAQSVLLPALLGLSLEKTGRMLGVGRASVHRLQTRLRKSRTPTPAVRNWGGRRNSLMSMEEEKLFLAPWARQAATGSMIVVSALRAALSQKLGRNVSPTLAYRMLARHGWRKLAPDTRHPKSDPAAQEEWKKTA